MNSITAKILTLNKGPFICTSNLKIHLAIRASRARVALIPRCILRLSHMAADPL